MRSTLVNAAPAAIRPQLEAIDELEASLVERYEHGRAAWAVNVSRDAFATHLAGHLGAEPQKAISGLHADFYLAVALSQHDPAALELFGRVVLPRVRTMLERRAPSAPVVEEVMVSIEDRLLVSGPAGGRIAHYAGRGSLERFVRAAAVNQLMNRLRSPQGESLDDALAGALIDPRQSPELATMSRDARAVFFGALGAAFQSLPSRDRLLLRLHTFENATINDIGRMYQVHKVTAFRWLEEARTHLRVATLAKLRESHALPESEIDSFLRQVPGSLEISLKTMFQSLEPQG